MSDKSEDKYRYTASTVVLPLRELPTFYRPLVEFVGGLKVTSVALSFGWESDLPDDKQPQNREVSTETLLATLEKIAPSGFRLGRTDIWVTSFNPSFQFQFCNDADLHIYANARPIVEAMIDSWKRKGFPGAEGFKVYEWKDGGWH